MNKSGFNSQLITNDDKIILEGVTSLTLANYGADDLTVTVNDVSRKVPAFNTEIGVPYGSFNIPGDGTACDVTLVVKFNGTSKNAILDYRLIKKC
ncbi:hypothetical protein FUA48_08630 [Flavobacterium alkalisoli]|uniref:Uncharacterized protein n=1 Tax=Flavobacterium alkalisoli TaxID=2602769 RepID=A0A5B9FU83_9FLAO|nr:hypothetical protein [Flavobacterium alkalisoli]QEE49646.1 hypothetical protein FUA48_08630 [Flavobacterium alkalisoli]